MNSLSPVNGYSTSSDGLESSLSTLKSIASTGYVDIEWSILKQAIKSKLHQNVQLYLAPSTQISAQLEPSPFPKSSPVVPFSEEEEDRERSSRSPADVTTNSTNLSVRMGESAGVAADNGTAEKGSNDVSLSERLGPIDVIGGRTLPGKVNSEEAEFMESRVSRLLDEFESDPPFTIQRLCEILVDPQSIHSNLGKHIRAIERTLLVTSTFQPPSPSNNNSISTFLTKTNPSNVPGHPISPRNSSAPLFSPIPFLALQMPPPQSVDPVSSSTGSNEPNEMVVTRPMSPLSLEPRSDQEMTDMKESAVQPSVETVRPSMPLGLASRSTSTTPSGLIEPDELKVDELDAEPSCNVTSDERAEQETTIGDHQPAGSNTNHRHFLANRPVALTSTTSIPDGPLLAGAASGAVLGAVLKEDSVRQRSLGDDDEDNDGQAEDAKKSTEGEEVKRV
ncbi:Protein phosphatase 4 regulatory subunit 2 related protein [Phaffia rhodozyma]|uniref:Protein phosphatase 4 regulatory subunit 2 related protein n=1 Tax=Phaffia rhodozyma TaxID=264483 RepID=A0A0F7SYM2_PHARH|nr:Protein phosphatase 4 regulatory subunit 2 related protein [Phaffia rhodozyma]